MNLFIKTFPWIFILVMTSGCQDVDPSRVQKKIQQKKDSMAIEEVVQQMDILREMGIDTGMLKHPRSDEATFNSAGDTIHVRVSTVFDSLRYIQIPKTYLDLVAVTDFGMYAPYYVVEVWRDGRFKLKDTIQRTDFSHLADSSLKKYGVLSFPRIGLKGDSVELSCSYVIPLSDVGIAVQTRYAVR
jgi:hypothetical protein